MIEIALLIGIVFFSFGFLLLAYSVIQMLTARAETDAAKSGQRSADAASQTADPAAGFGSVRPASI